MRGGFHARATGPELMDLPDCDPVRLLRTVSQFRLLNRLFSASQALLERHLLGTVRRLGLPGFSFLDIGAGGCDITIRLVRRCRRLGIRVSATCIDHDPRIVAWAVTACRRYPEIRILAHPVEQLATLGEFDFVFANNFLHHFPDAGIPALLGRIAAAARLGFLLNDIHRSRAAWFGFSLFAGLFLHRSFARHDGRLSIRRGFRTAELKEAVSRAGLAERTRILRRQPARICILGNGFHPAAGAVDFRNRHSWRGENGQA